MADFFQGSSNDCILTAKELKRESNKSSIRYSLPNFLRFAQGKRVTLIIKKNQQPQIQYKDQNDKKHSAFVFKMETYHSSVFFYFYLTDTKRKNKKCCTNSKILNLMA